MILPLAHLVRLEGDRQFGWRLAGVLLAGLLLVAYWQGWIQSPFQWDLAIALTFIFGYRTFHRAVHDLLGRKASADQAVTLAALAALYVGEYLAAAEVVYIMLLGETLEDYAARRFHTDLNRLLSCLPHQAHVLRNGKEENVHLEELRSNDHVIIYPGERVPVDGTVIEGESLIDESSITGESLPRERLRGDQVYAGALNQTSRLVLQAQQVGEQTVLNRIVDLVRHAKENRAPIQRTADRYAKWFLPLVVTIAAVCYLLTGEWMRSVAILIVACPCAMVLSTPAAVLASVSALARNGILVKGGVHLEKLSQVDCIAFDKTGTLTKGEPRLIEVITFDGFHESEVLAFAASLEHFSEHLLGRAIREAAEERKLPIYPTEEVERHAGLGLEGKVEMRGRTPDLMHVMVGSLRFLHNRGIDLSPDQATLIEQQDAQESISVGVAIEGRPAGMLILRDLPRPEAAKALQGLGQLGIRKLLLMTGDRANAAHQVARSVGIAEVHANLLPEEKLARLEELRHQGYTVAMLGDGVNDSPSLAAADVGVAMGDTGTDIAADAAGVVLTGEGGLDRLPKLLQASRRTVKTIQDNIFWFGLVFNLIAVLAAFIGYLSAVAAAVVHQASSLIVVVNSLKLLDRRPVQFLPHRLQHALHHLQHRFEHFRHPSSLAQTLVDSIRIRRRSVVRAGLAALPALYLLSGVTLIAPDQVGVVQRFGRVLDQVLEPGLHYTFPWPVDELHQLYPDRVQSIDLGFRIVQEDQRQVDLPAYEWNIQHRLGRYTRRPEEALALTGDEYLVEVNTVVQYSIRNPRQFLFRTDNLETALRALCEGALRSVVSTMELDQVLALNRTQIEELALQMVRREVDELALGVRVHSLNLQDVHPALEVVAAFRKVASALEQRSQMINEAQAYANERVPVARGASHKTLMEAEIYRTRQTNEAVGKADRFNSQYEAYRFSPETTKTRLYLETVEIGLAGKPKYILDMKSGRRKMMLFKDGIFILDGGLPRKGSDETRREQK